jgi:hypothetical protein
LIYLHFPLWFIDWRNFLPIFSASDELKKSRVICK